MGGQESGSRRFPPSSLPANVAFRIRNNLPPPSGSGQGCAVARDKAAPRKRGKQRMTGDVMRRCMERVRNLFTTHTKRSWAKGGGFGEVCWGGSMAGLGGHPSGAPALFSSLGMPFMIRDAAYHQLLTERATLCPVLHQTTITYRRCAWYGYVPSICTSTVTKPRACRCMIPSDAWSVCLHQPG